MERKLFIIRHGKSSWESVVNDIDRPLTERGVRNSYMIANQLNDNGLRPDAVYTSPANRAMHTAIIMSQIWNVNERNIKIRKQLYLPEEEDIYKVIYEIPDEFSAAAIFGHNPGFTNFANHFLDDTIDNLPTAGVLIVTFEMDKWVNLSSARVIDTIFDYPKRGM